MQIKINAKLIVKRKQFEKLQKELWDLLEKAYPNWKTMSKEECNVIIQRDFKHLNAFFEWFNEHVDEE